MFRRATLFQEVEMRTAVAPPPGLASLRAVDGKLVENWYIFSLSNELSAEKPVSRVVYETPLVGYRDETGRAVVMLDRCLHRGARLSAGVCREGKLSCPYHGWTYGANGQVCEIPSEGKSNSASLKRRAWSGRTLPLIEQDGVIWVWTGEGDSSKVQPWRFPYAEDSNWTGYFMVTDFENEVTHLVENFMDVPHTVYVHDKWFRKKTEMKVPITVEVANGRVIVTYVQPGDSIGFTSKMMNPDGAPMVHTDVFIFPNVTRVDYTFGDRGYVINSQCTPIGRYKTRVYTWISYRLFKGPVGRIAHSIIKSPMNYYTRQVIEQDVDIMKNQGRNLLSLDEQGRAPRFKSTGADELHIAVERLREMGVAGDEGVMTTAWARERELWI